MMRRCFCFLAVSLVFLCSKPVFGSEDDECQCFSEICCSNFQWIPNVPLFRPFVADPRALSFSIGWRFGDEVFNKNMAPVSFDNHFGIFRLENPFGYCGTLQLELEAGVWAVFEHTDDLMPLDNADYYVGVPLIYRNGPWKYRLRVWHMSSHLGDEFMEKHPEITRKNPSAEYLDFFVSYEPSWQLRMYGGIGYVLRSDKHFPCKHFYAEYGLETRLAWLNTFYNQGQLWGRPFAGAHFRSKEDNDYKFDGTFVFGYEWAKRCDFTRRVRLFLEYHSGYSVEGQFCHLETDYFAIRLSYGY